MGFAHDATCGARTMCAASTVAVGLHHGCRGFTPRLPWVVTHGCVMPPLRGSGINNASTVGSAHDVRVTHGCVMSPPCGSVLCHRYAVHMVVFVFRGFRARCARHPRLCYVTAMRFGVMSPLCGSVLCHRYAVLCYATPTGFIWWCTFFRGFQ